MQGFHTQPNTSITTDELQVESCKDEIESASFEENHLEYHEN